MQQIKGSKRALWNPNLYLHSGMQSHYQKKKKILFDSYTHEHIMQVINAGLLEFVSAYSDPIYSFCWNVLG